MAVDGTAYCAYVSSGQVRKMVTTITGLSHLNGEAIQVQVDGALPTGDNAFTVSGGSITLPAKAAVVHAGLPYQGTIQMLKTSDGSNIGTGQTKMRRVYLAALRITRSLGIKVGIDATHTDPIFDGTPALPLVSADQDKFPNTGWDQEVEFVIKQDLPLPAHILSIILRSEIEEK